MRKRSTDVKKSNFLNEVNQQGVACKPSGYRSPAVVYESTWPRRCEWPRASRRSGHRPAALRLGIRPSIAMTHRWLIPTGSKRTFSQKTRPEGLSYVHLFEVGTGFSSGRKGCKWKASPTRCKRGAKAQREEQGARHEGHLVADTADIEALAQLAADLSS